MSSAYTMVMITYIYWRQGSMYVQTMPENGLVREEWVKKIPMKPEWEAEATKTHQPNVRQ